MAGLGAPELLIILAVFLTGLEDNNWRFFDTELLGRWQSAWKAAAEDV